MGIRQQLQSQKIKKKNTYISDKHSPRPGVGRYKHFTATYQEIF
jgi:hypothetical protein